MGFADLSIRVSDMVAAGDGYGTVGGGGTGGGEEGKGECESRLVRGV